MSEKHQTKSYSNSHRRKQPIAMTQDQNQKPEQQLWDIANEPRGRVGADKVRDDIPGVIFFNCLPAKPHPHANESLETEDVRNNAAVTDKEYIQAESLENPHYFPRPDELFTAITRNGAASVQGRNNFMIVYSGKAET